MTMRGDDDRDESEDREIEVEKDSEPEDVKEVEKPSEDEDDEDATPAQRASRKERRRERGQNHALKAMEERFQRTLEEREARFSQTLETVLERVAPRQKPEAGPDSLDERIELKKLKYNQLLSEYNSLSLEDQKAKFNEYDEKAAKLRDEQLELQYERIAKKRGHDQPQRHLAHVDPTVQAVHMKLRAEYSDVTSNEAAMTFAQAEWKRAVAGGADKNDPKVLEQALVKARRWNGGGNSLGRPRASSDEVERSRERMTSAPRGGGGSTETQERWSITKQEQKLAHTLYANLSPEKAERKWLKEVKYAK